MGFLINVVAKWTGAGKVWDAMDGYKLYATGFLAILGALAGLGAEVAPILASHNTAALLAFLNSLNSDPAYLALLAGCGTIAGAHRLDKAASPTQ